MMSFFPFHIKKRVTLFIFLNSSLKGGTVLKLIVDTVLKAERFSLFIIKDGLVEGGQASES